MRGLSSKKRFFKSCPKFLLDATVKTTRKAREVKIRADSLFHPEKTKWYCPCCGLKCRTFVSGHYLEKQTKFNPERYEHIKQEVLCSFCKSLPRHRILALWCDKYKEDLKVSKILFFAPEYSMKLWMKRNGIRFTSADLYKDKVDLKLDIEETGLPNASYGVVIANHVLEHVDDFRTALREVYRILKPGGMFICSFPMDPKIKLLDEEEKTLSAAERIKRFGQNDHKRVFGMNADQFLTEAGFDVEKIRGEEYPEKILPVVGPADYDMNILFCCRKNADQ